MQRSKWFFYKGMDRRDHGPADLDELRVRIKAGTLSPLTRVRSLGSRRWSLMAEVDELQSVFCASAGSFPQPVWSDHRSDLVLADVPAFLNVLMQRCVPWIVLGLCAAIALYCQASLLWVLTRECALPGFDELTLGGGVTGMVLQTVTLCWAAVVPPAIWFAWRKRRRTLGRLIGTEMLAYLLPAVTVWIWCQRAGLSGAQFLGQLSPGFLLF